MRKRIVLQAAAGLCLALWMGCQSPSKSTAASGQRETSQPVNTGQGGRVITPVNQVLTPAGIQVELLEMRPQALALSPDGSVLAVSGHTAELLLVDPDSGAIRQRVPLPSEQATNTVPEAVSTHILQPDTHGQLSFTGLIFSPDGKRIYLSNVAGSIKVFARNETSASVEPLASLALPDSGISGRPKEIPSGLALSADGARLYVVLNLSNRLLEMEAATGKVLRIFAAGVAPFDVVLAGGKAYVSNWGGRRPGAEDVTGPAGHGTRVRVDPVRHIASEGSVSIIDLATGRATKELLTGLHACAMALAPGNRTLAVANAGDDTVSFIDTARDEVTKTFSLRWAKGDPFGANPNALTFSADGRTLYVCNGTQNAIAVVPTHSRRPMVQGLIPTAWFPGAVVLDDARRKLHVANIKGVGSGKRLAPGEPAKFNSHQSIGSLSLIDLPSSAKLKEQTQVALENMRHAWIRDAFLPPRPGQPPRPVPERAGEPSPFKHVVYIIKENRTYDQVLGDMPEGNGNADLCIFGEKFTPNHHKIAREFVLLDNTYCSGILSADGHNWTGSAMANDYLERSFAGWPRSYPDGMEESDTDALAYSSAGFIWDNALAQRKTVRSYGEFTMGTVRWKDAARKDPLSFPLIWQDFRDQTGLIDISSVPAVESLRGHIMTNTIGWDMKVPDVFRAAQFIKELRAFEATGGFPELSIICLPNDHTSGTSPGRPTPSAHIADNDLAFGQIVEAISRSKFWPETCILAIEDDPQAGWDHVSGFRTVAFVVSPYTKRGAVISHNYNQTGVIRTMELILGLPPMNQLDATATPLSACFTNQPNFTPYTAVPNRVPLDEINPQPRAIYDPVLRHDALVSSALPLEKMDACPEDVLNRILWRAQRGSNALYPAWALTRVPEELEEDEDDK